MIPPWHKEAARILACLLTAAAVASCGEHGLLPTTVDPGPDFSVAEVVFDEGFFYCKVEPMMMQQGCGAGDSGRGESAAGCHASVTAFRFQPYSPLVATTCGDGVVPNVVTPDPPVTGQQRAIAQQNYQSAQSRMRRDVQAAPLFNRPTGRTQHPRVLFDASSPEAELLRQWASQYSSR